MYGYGRCGASVHQRRDPASVLQTFLESTNGRGSEELSPTRRHDRRDRQSSRGRGDHRKNRRRLEGRIGTVQENGHGVHGEDTGEFR